MSKRPQKNQNQNFKLCEFNHPGVKREPGPKASGNETGVWG